MTTRTPARSLLAAGLAVGLLSSVAAADGRAEPSLDLSLAYQHPDSPPLTDAPAPPAHPRFGSAGSQWLTLNTGVSNDFGSDTGLYLAGGWSVFVADDLEFGVEAGGWYFIQDGDDTGGVSGMLRFRWHHWHDPDYTWSVYSELGIGLLGAFDQVPDGGSGFDFLPRAGLGYTRRLGDDGTRLDVGIRWQHISNGRLEGDSRNPGRDSAMIYAGLIVPF